MRAFHTPCLFLAAVTYIWPVNAQDSQDAAGKKIFESSCSACHGADIVIGLVGTRAYWQKSVDTMRGRGAEGTDEDFKRIVDYLAKYFGPSVNMNEAAARELTTELQITADEAAAIVRYRSDKGKLSDWTDLMKVPGVDIKRLEPLKGRIKF